MTTRIIPIVTFPNEPGAILDYLAQRTADTIGAQADRAEIIIIGHVREYEIRSKTVRRQHVGALKPWLVKQTRSEPHILLHTIVVEVERWLKGTEAISQLTIIYPHGASVAPAPGEMMPLFDSRDRGLIFLQQIPPDLPYLPYLPKPAYQLAPGETGVRNFLVTDYDEDGKPFTRDDTLRIEETILALEWYLALPRKNADALRSALLKSIESANTRIARCAVRELGHRKEPGADVVFRDIFRSTADEDLKERLMIGLWLLGEKEDAIQCLETIMQSHGKERWLARWDIQTTIAQEQTAQTLYAPDPAEVRGD